MVGAVTRFTKRSVAERPAEPILSPMPETARVILGSLPEPEIADALVDSRN